MPEGKSGPRSPGLQRALAGMLPPLEDALARAMQAGFLRRWYAASGGEHFAIAGSYLLELWRIEARPAADLDLVARPLAARWPDQILSDACGRDLNDGLAFDPETTHLTTAPSVRRYSIPWRYEGQYRGTLSLDVIYDLPAPWTEWLPLAAPGAAAARVLAIGPEYSLALTLALTLFQGQSLYFQPGYLDHVRKIVHAMPLDRERLEQSLLLAQMACRWSAGDLHARLRQATDAHEDDAAWNFYLESIGCEPYARYDAWLDVREALEYAQAGEPIPGPDERTFLRALRVNAGDDPARTCYADWLEDRGDPRAEYLRLECEAHEGTRDFARREELTLRMEQLAHRFSARWLNQIRREPRSPRPT